MTEIVGAVGGKLHTGRSRNDQVATDFRLWVMDSIDELRPKLTDLQTALCDKAGEHVETVMPGYTHVQPAQPITAGRSKTHDETQVHRYSQRDCIVRSRRQRADPVDELRVVAV